MLKNILDMEGVTILNKKQKSTINGGASFSCYCGFTGGPFEDFKFNVEADNLNDALWGAGHACGGRGATCSGN